MCQVCSLHCRCELMGWSVDGESFVPLVTVHPLCPRNSHRNIKPQHESSVQNVQISISLTFSVKAMMGILYYMSKVSKNSVVFSILYLQNKDGYQFSPQFFCISDVSDASNKGTE